jgi:hypothetical protein
MFEEIQNYLMTTATEPPEEAIAFMEATTNLNPRKNPEHMKALKMQTLFAFLRKMDKLDEKSYLFAMRCAQQIFGMEITAAEEELKKNHDDIVALQEDPPTDSSR